MAAAAVETESGWHVQPELQNAGQGNSPPLVRSINFTESVMETKVGMSNILKGGWSLRRWVHAGKTKKCFLQAR